MLLRRKELTQEYMLSAGRAIGDRVLASELYAGARSIFIYASVPGEPPTERIIEHALAAGKSVYLPKCTGGRMLAVRIYSTGDLRPGVFGIPEPADQAETLGADELDLIIAPCLAASEDGRRLGHGAGYYDRFLARERENVLCLCFRQMLCDDIPEEETDIRIRSIITE